MNRVRNPFGGLFHEVNAVQEQFARLVNRVAPYAAATAAGVSGPLLNVWEDENALYVEADLPGIDPAKLDITVAEGNHLTVGGERAVPEVAGAVWVRQERPAGKFARSVGLPALVDADKVEAKYENGVLRLTLPKHEAAKPRKIQVKAGE
ncbi:MAG: Hsp20/alpha crystallin family protein [Gemmataceae bacterium]|nr:Hsp20/alpha crystallin family protein [Gemmataceae bacterium]